MVQFDIESNRELTLPDGTSIPVWQVLFGDVIDVKLLDPETGEPVVPLPRNKRVLIGDPVESYSLRFEAAPNFCFNMILDAQNRHANTPGLEGDGFVSVVDGSLYALNDDGSRGVSLDNREYLVE